MQRHLEQVLEDLVQQRKNIVVEQLSSPMKAFLISKIFSLSGKHILVVTGEGQEEDLLAQNLQFFTASSPIILPSWETVPSENIDPSCDIVGERQKALQSLSNPSKNLIVLSSLQATLQKVLSQAAFSKKQLVLKVGEEIPLDILSQHLQAVSYVRVPVTVEKGEFSVRGGIVDIFPVTEQRPVRIEFDADQIESIKFYDPLSQKTQIPLPHITITEAKEFSHLQDLSENDLQTVFDILGKDTIILLDDLEKCEDRYASLVSQGGVSSKTFLGMKEWLSIIAKFQNIYFSKIPLEELTEVRREKKQAVGSYTFTGRSEEISFSMFERTFTAERLESPCSSLPSFYQAVSALADLPEKDELIDCLGQEQEKYSHTIVVQSLVEVEYVKTKLDERGYALSPTCTIREGYLSSGFVRRDTNEVFFATSEVTGRKTVRRDAKRLTSLVTAYDAFDVKPNDLVVHFHHGLAKFCGIEKKLDVQQREQEFFVLEYADRAKLYVPLAQAHLITKYIGSEEKDAKLHALGSTRWKKLREDTERAILGYASDLLHSQALRVMKGGFVFPEDGLSMKLFESEFPYTETEDQIKAISDIKQDMISSKAMDRLICGDVGYGKTEVAMRAAFKAVADGKKQVALLAPTTVLAIQHYENFSERMGTFGVKVGVLSRFSTAKQNKQVISQLSSGEIDIIIGTHRLLQADVVFKDLGLVIIDEEQRFGVKAKEHLKIMKEGVDCITLSATPIPRTLYMSLISAKDLSTISTPPHDRLPIKTVVCEMNQEVVQSALVRELNRGGQAFVIHNRVETIFEFAEMIRKLVPKAVIGVAHGQMHADELDAVFHAFKNGEIEILVATSIVENGIDIPNANTIIVDKADLFGIADLYQLRGRVGRWNKRAFAYFLVSAKRLASDVARRRIEAIATSGGYGGGLKMAMRDLEIRGAGDILGTEQSGNVASIGFHLYCKLLKRTIDSLQGKSSVWMMDTRIETPYDAKLPEWYVNEVSLRMEFYQRLGEVKTLQEIDEIEKELLDRFGKLPDAALWLISVTKVRFLGAQRGFTLIKVENSSVVLEKKTGEKSSSNRVLLPKAKTPQDFYEKMHAIFCQ